MGRFYDILKEYMKNSSLHGVRFLIDDNISFVERLFWLFAIILSWIGNFHESNRFLTKFFL